MSSLGLSFTEQWRSMQLDGGSVAVDGAVAACFVVDLHELRLGLPDRVTRHSHYERGVGDVVADGRQWVDQRPAHLLHRQFAAHQAKDATPDDRPKPVRITQEVRRLQEDRPGLIGLAQSSHPGSRPPDSSR